MKNINADECITIEQFNELLLDRIGEVGTTDLMDEYEKLHAADILEKRTAARIMHRVLLRIIREEDNDNWSEAYALQDLFECHVCVADIAQIYVKGLMEPRRNTNGNGLVFGIHDPVTKDEAKTAIERLFETNKRIEVLTTEKPGPEFIDLQEYFLLPGETNAICVDLRNRDEYMNNCVICESKNMPFKSVFLNPYIVGENRQAHIYLYSDSEYQTTAAADVLHRSGYPHVTIIK